MVRESIIHKHKMIIKYFAKAGYNKEFIVRIHKSLLFFSSILSIISIFLLSYFSPGGVKYLLGMSLLIVTLGNLLLYFVILGIFYSFVDMKIYFRKKEIELMLPEFLLLTSSNMKAGMLIDQAFLYAARPKFGVLTEEINYVLKEVATGGELKVSLKNFSEKYDSEIVKRSIDLIIQGSESGGRLAEILNKISINLSELALQKKEMSASVTTYTIFIGFASLVAAPALMALAGQLLMVIKSLMVTLSSSGSQSSSSSFISFTVPKLTQGNYTMFAVIMLVTTSFFSAMIVAVIRKGSVKQGLKYIPIFIFVSLTTYFVSNYFMSSFFGGMFAF